jgi:long-subunit fatty acid transport protein
VDPDFDSVYGWRLGAELFVWEPWILRVGYGNLPSPAPDQAIATNILGSDVQVISVGADWRFMPTGALQAFAQWHLFDEQSVTETAAGSVPAAWSMDGNILTVGAGVQLKF